MSNYPYPPVSSTNMVGDMIELEEAITEIANYKLHKKHPDLSVEAWQAKVILEALTLFLEEYNKLLTNTGE